jgi:hypothetical protein
VAAGFAATPCQRAVGRFPWFAFFFLRALPLRERLANRLTSVWTLCPNLSRLRGTHK